MEIEASNGTELQLEAHFESMEVPLTQYTRRGGGVIKNAEMKLYTTLNCWHVS